MNLIARRTDTGEYLMPRKYGQGHWSPDPQAARVFRRKGDLSNSVANCVPYYRRKAGEVIPFEAIEVAFVLAEDRSVLA